MVTQFNKPVVCPVLIDRVNDLATLHTLIDQAKSGRDQVALLRLSLSHMIYFLYGQNHDRTLASHP